MERGPRPKIATVERREASVPRHGTRRASLARIGRVSQTRQQNKCACRRSAHPSLGGGRERKARTRAQQRAAGTKNTALFDIVKYEAANGSSSREFRTPEPPHPRASRSDVSRRMRRPPFARAGLLSVRSKAAGRRHDEPTRAWSSLSCPLFLRRRLEHHAFELHAVGS